MAAPVMSRKIQDPVEEALNVTVPAWPLQNTVAVNPFWNLRDRPFSQVTAELASVLHRPLFMPLAYYLQKYREGLITEAALATALDSAKASRTPLPETLDKFLQASLAETEQIQEIFSFAEYSDHKTASSWQRVVSGEISKYASAYFDSGQALAQFPWHTGGFWNGWQASMAYDQSMEAAGVKHFRDSLALLITENPRNFINAACAALGLTADAHRSKYFARLFAQNFGWSSQFRYIEWQKSLGYAVSQVSDPVEWLAVLVAYDLGIARFVAKRKPNVQTAWLQTFQAVKPADSSKLPLFELHELWQNAFELSYQRRVAGLISPTKANVPPAPYQIAMCIDVRSEMLRRHLEGACSTIQSIGFAGFFGLAFDYKRADEKAVGHRLPVLLSPAFTVKEEAKNGAAHSPQNKALFDAYFKVLRKSSYGAFGYIELCGIFSLGKIWNRFVDSFWPRKVAAATPLRFRDQCYRPSQSEVYTPLGDKLGVSGKVDRAAGILKHMGLTQDFGRLVVITGHGSATTNNAFGSSLDCGACGGHAGDINARFLVGLLNDPAIRDGLRAKGLFIPDHTRFIAAVHETVTDAIYLLDQEALPVTHREDLQKLQLAFAKASTATRLERQLARSEYLDVDAMRRSQNWAEVRPEWGLAGNACFIVAPRRWTVGANFSSRAFLHDYNWQDDEGFSTLELIMTAPMIVTNWINMQYYASTVVPEVYGAGNKLLHNVVNECGVLEGNSGDLRVGLPIQSVHDGEKFVHEPLRLSVYLAAPQAEIEKIIARHAVVRELVDHEWLHILHIDESMHTVSRRAPFGRYLAL